MSTDLNMNDLTDKEPMALSNRRGTAPIYVNPELPNTPSSDILPFKGTSTWAVSASIGSSISSAPQDGVCLCNVPMSWQNLICPPVIQSNLPAPSLSVPAERQAQHCTEKWKHVKETPEPEVMPCGVDDQVSKLRSEFSNLPIPAPHFVVGNVNGDKVEDLSVHFERCDVLIVDLFDIMVEKSAL